ncbi:MAG: glycerol-3-phosphate dehydrogenase, partial [OM182 bacterium]|nr:glycerol-3-phosphate dehydrogenase [OM182 bacterium]
EAEFDGVLETVHIDEDEIAYLIEVANGYFKRQLSRGDVISTYSGVRPLIDEEGKDATKVSRDYHLEPHKSAVPLLSIYGGKVTTYRTLAEDVMKALAPTFPKMGAPWTKLAPLPGGNYSTQFGGKNIELKSVSIAKASAESEAALSTLLSAQAPWLRASLLKRWLQTYGTETQTLLGDANSTLDLGMHLGADLYSREVDYLIAHEWARNADDILWRRTKLGYLFDERGKAVLADYITTARAAAAQGAG